MTLTKVCGPREDSTTRCWSSIRIGSIRGSALAFGERGQTIMVQGKPIRILSVENYSVFREGLATIIGSQQDMLLVAHASNAAEAVSEFRRHRPDVTLMDLRLPETNGTDVLIAIRGEFPQARIIMLPTLDSEGEILRALRAGASAYILFVRNHVPSYPGSRPVLIPEKKRPTECQKFSDGPLTQTER